MNDYIIKIGESLTTSVFYGRITTQVNDYLSSNERILDQRLVLDFSETVFVDSLMIPNLLCLGFILKDKCTNQPVINTVNTDVYVSTTNILKYFEEIGFNSISRYFNLFLYRNLDPIHPGKREMLPDFCTTFFFAGNQMSKRDIAESIYQKSYKLFTTYLNSYYDDDEVYGHMNTFTKFAAELCHNAQLHGNSNAIMTLQVNKKIGKVFIAVSDIGIGFSASVLSKVLQQNTQRNILLDSEKNMLQQKNVELLAILEGAFYRYFDRDYGISSIAQIVMKNNGIIRIHSSKTRVVLTSNSFSGFTNRCDTPERLKELLYRELISRKEYSIQSEVAFQGVHYEISMPINS